MVELAFLHGFTGSPASFGPVEALLPESTTVLAPFLPGHGVPPAFPFVRSFFEAVDAIASYISERSQHPIALCGYSLGGRLALWLAIRHPKLVQRLILIGAHPGLKSDIERQQRRLEDERWITLLESQGLSAFVDAWEYQSLFTSQKAALNSEQKIVQRAIRLGHTNNGLSATLSAMGLGAMPDARPALSQITMPIQLVVGQEDTRFLAIAEEILPHLQHGELRIIPDAGHNVIIEQPAAVAAILLEDVV